MYKKQKIESKNTRDDKQTQHIQIPLCKELIIHMYTHVHTCTCDISPCFVYYVLSIQSVNVHTHSLNNNKHGSQHDASASKAL